MSRALPRVLTLFVAAAMLPVSAVAAGQVPPPGFYRKPARAGGSGRRHQRRHRRQLCRPDPSSAVRGHRVRGGVWTNDAVGADARIGLVSMGGSGFTARFDDVRVHRLLP